MFGQIYEVLRQFDAKGEALLLVGIDDIAIEK